MCRSNGARSQMAEAFFQEYSNQSVKSAGIDVSKTLYMGSSPGAKTIEIMRNCFGIDISKKKRKQVTTRMLNASKRVIILMTPSERRKLPAYFKKFRSKTVFWNVRDMRNARVNAPLVKRAKRIRRLVQKLVEKQVKNPKASIGASSS